MSHVSDAALLRDPLISPVLPRPASQLSQAPWVGPLICPRLLTAADSPVSLSLS